MKNIIDSLNWRYATKQFDSEKKLSEEQLNTIKETLRMTPSSFGLQPWKFVFVENTQTREKLKEASWNQSQVTDASHLLVLCRENKIDQNLVDEFFEDMKETTGAGDEDVKGYKDMVSGFVGNLDSENAKTWAEKQVYIALGNLMTVLAHMRIDSCPMEGFDNAAYDEILGLQEEGLSSVLVLPIGYRAHDDESALRPKIRYNTQDLFLEI